MSLVGKKIEEFSTDAYLGGKFIKVSDKDFMENGMYFVSIQRTFHLFARQS